VSLSPKLWPGLRVHSVCASVLFKIPIWRHMLGWLGIRPATRSQFVRLLRRHGSVKVNPGGIAEMYLIDSAAEVIKILGRKGFVRIAVEHGVPLLPVYHFGNSRLLNFGPKVRMRARGWGQVGAKGGFGSNVGGCTWARAPAPRRETSCLQQAPLLRSNGHSAAGTAADAPALHSPPTGPCSSPLPPRAAAQFLEPLSRRVRASIGLITGRWGLPLPYKVPLHMVVGDLVPVPCLPRDHPGFEAAVDQAHAAYMGALRALYERHRATYGWAGRPLVMV
jgi:hypothetical protein